MTNKYKTINVTTPEGTLKYPKLNEPDTKFNPGGVYQAKIILSEEAAASIVDKMKAAQVTMFEETKASLEAKINEEKGEKKAKLMAELKKLKMADLPVKDTVNDEGEPDGNLELNFSMKAVRTDKTGKTFTMKPKMFDAKGKLIASPPSVWGGTTACVAGQIAPFYTPLVGVGVSLRLSAVQIINLVNGSGGTADSYGFGAKAGYEAAGSEPEETFTASNEDVEDDF